MHRSSCRFQKHIGGAERRPQALSCGRMLRGRRFWGSPCASERPASRTVTKPRVRLSPAPVGPPDSYLLSVCSVLPTQELETGRGHGSHIPAGGSTAWPEATAGPRRFLSDYKLRGLLRFFNGRKNVKGDSYSVTCENDGKFRLQRGDCSFVWSSFY